MITRGDHACGCVSSDNRALLMNVTSYLVDDFGGTHLNEDILNETVMTVFSCLTSLGTLLVSPTSEGMAFADLMAVLVNLAEEESGLGHVQVWSLTQFYSVDFSKSRIGVNKCVLYKRTIKVCVSCY